MTSHIMILSKIRDEFCACTAHSTLYMLMVLISTPHTKKLRQHQIILHTISDHIQFPRHRNAQNEAQFNSHLPYPSSRLSRQLCHVFFSILACNSRLLYHPDGIIAHLTACLEIVVCHLYFLHAT